MTARVSVARHVTGVATKANIMSVTTMAEDGLHHRPCRDPPHPFGAALDGGAVDHADDGDEDGEDGAFA